MSPCSGGAHGNLCYAQMGLFAHGTVFHKDHLGAHLSFWTFWREAVRPRIANQHIFMLCFVAVRQPCKNLLIFLALLCFFFFLSKCCCSTKVLIYKLILLIYKLILCLLGKVFKQKIIIRWAKNPQADIDLRIFAYWAGWHQRMFCLQIIYSSKGWCRYRSLFVHVHIFHVSRITSINICMIFIQLMISWKLTQSKCFKSKGKCCTCI